MPSTWLITTLYSFTRSTSKSRSLYPPPSALTRGQETYLWVDVHDGGFERPWESHCAVPLSTSSARRDGAITHSGCCGGGVWIYLRDEFLLFFWLLNIQIHFDVAFGVRGRVVGCVLNSLLSKGKSSCPPQDQRWMRINHSRTLKTYSLLIIPYPVVSLSPIRRRRRTWAEIFHSNYDVSLSHFLRRVCMVM